MQIHYWHTLITSLGFIFERTNSPPNDCTLTNHIFHFTPVHVVCLVNKLISVYSRWLVYFFAATSTAVYSLEAEVFRPDVFVCSAWRLTLMPSIRKPRVAVELSVSLHCMYRGLRTPCLARSSSVGAPGSTAIILSYMSFLKRGRSLAFVSSSSK